MVLERCLSGGTVVEHNFSMPIALDATTPTRVVGCFGLLLGLWLASLSYYSYYRHNRMRDYCETKELTLLNIIDNSDGGNHIGNVEINGILFLLLDVQTEKSQLMQMGTSLINSTPPWSEKITTDNQSCIAIFANQSYIPSLNEKVNFLTHCKNCDSHRLFDDY